MELVLEGLTQHLKIAREDLDSRVSYTEMLKFNLVRNRGPTRLVILSEAKDLLRGFQGASWRASRSSAAS